jgi:hypothetical protein
MVQSSNWKFQKLRNEVDFEATEKELDCTKFSLDAWKSWEMHTIFWFENLEGRDHLEDLGVDGKIISEWILGQ